MMTPSDGDDCPPAVRDEGPRQHEELAHEAVEARHPDGGEHGDGEQRREDRGRLLQAAQLGRLPRAPALVDEADEDEQRGHDEAVVQHEQHPAGQALGADGDRAQRDEADVGQRGVGHQALHVALRARHHGAVDDPDHGQGQQQGRQGPRRLGEEVEVEADDAVGAELGQDAGQEDRALLWRLGVGVGRPGVQGEERRLHREGGRERQEQQDLGRRRQVGLHQRAERERQVVVLGLVDEGERQDADQQERRAEEGEEEELDGRVGPPLVAPPGDDEVGGHERQLEHEEEHEQVEREEAAHHGRLEQQQPGEVDAAVLAVAAEHDGDGEEHRRQQHQEDGDAVDAEVPVHPERAAGVLVVRDQLESAVVRPSWRPGRRWRSRG